MKNPIEAGEWLNHVNSAFIFRKHCCDSEVLNGACEAMDEGNGDDPMSIQKEKEISHPLSEEKRRDNLDQPHKSYKIHNPHKCAGYPTCKECMNILC
jgi:hypothetical protein